MFALVGTLVFSFGVERVKAEVPIYIRADGSVEPLTANITTSDNVTYAFNGSNYGRVFIERGDIVVDGSGYVLEGSDFGNGFSISDVSNVTIRDVEVRGFSYGIYVYNSSNNMFYWNNVTNNSQYGFYIYRALNNSVYENRVWSNGEFSYHGWASVYVAYSSNCTIRMNNITLNPYLDGVQFWEASENFVYGNNIIDNYFGIRLLSNSDGNFAFENNVTTCYIGVELWDSSNNKLYNNLFSGNSYGFGVDGFELSHYLHNISVSNLVDGKPVYYLINQHGLAVNSSTHPEIGWLALVNSTSVRVEGLNFTGNRQGLLFAYTNDSSIVDNNIVGNYDGTVLFSSVNNTLWRNNISVNEYYAVYLWEYSDDNWILDNSIVDNLYQGIYLSDSSNNTVCGNKIANSEYGMEVYGSNNFIYLNNFLNNTDYQVYTYNDMPNFWDNGVEGNYWSDYNGTDANLDGIGDSWRVFDSNNTDHYPLMSMFSSFNTSLGCFVNIVSNSSVDSFEYFEGNTTIVMHVSNMTANQTGGFCRIRIPYSVVAEPFNVTIDGINPTYWNYSVYDDGANRWIYFNYQISALEIVIVPELSLMGVIGLFMLTTLVATIFYRRKRLAWF